MLARVLYAGTHNPSFEQASQALRQLADLSVPTKQVERLTQRLGVERCAERDAAVAAYRQRPLVERKAPPAAVAAPDLAVVQMDGGRLQILDRSQPAAALGLSARVTPLPETAAAAAAAAVPPTAAIAAAVASQPAGHWREDKVGLLATMTSPVSAVDPCPQLPEHFVDPLRILKLTREIKGATGVTEEEVATLTPAPATAAPEQATRYTAPILEQRSVVATRANVNQFGDMLAQAAWERGFYGAERRAFVADGSSANWGVWERHFSNFVPIVDFIHALTYVFHGAMAGRSFTLGWAAYTAWIAQVWAGDIEAVIAALAQRQVELGPPAKDEAETSPRHRVAAALSYLQNQKERMRYAAYRKQGLPMTSSHIESTIKQINQRVKGTEKFWSEAGAEAILQLRADTLSETEPLVGFWERRQAAATGQRRYSRAG